MSRSVVIVGAGALGSACAAVFVSRRWRVNLIDPGEGPSASAVAAGMLAPASEAVLDRADLPRTDLLRTARDRWTAFADRIGLELISDGALWRGPAMEDAAVRLRSLGFVAERRPEGVFTTADARLDPGAALRQLQDGADLVRGRVAAVETHAHEVEVSLTSGERLAADHLILATGVEPFAAAAGPFRAVTPVRGQLVELGGEAPPCVIRGAEVYVVPSAGGMLVGASMEPGRRDLAPDPAVTARLLQAAAEIWPAVAEAGPGVARVGVRGATPDGLPLAGPVGPRISVALAPRRNGWLLAPLVAEVVAAYAAGDDPGPFAAALDPLRFQPK